MIVLNALIAVNYPAGILPWFDILSFFAEEFANLGLYSLVSLEFLSLTARDCSFAPSSWLGSRFNLNLRVPFMLRIRGVVIPLLGGDF